MKEPVFPERLAECYREMEKITLPETAVVVNGAALAFWDKGSPLIRYAPPLIDPNQFIETARQVFELLARYLPEMAADLQLLRESLPRTADDRKALIEGLIKHDREAVTFLEDRTPVPPDVFGFAFSHVLRIFLGAYSQRLHREADLDGWWRGECPVCGSKPNFARVDARGRRYLHCGLCSTEWRFARAVCPFCGNTAPEDLSFYAFEGGLYRVYVCNRCKGYIKTLVGQEPDQARPNLFWEDIKTVPLDMAAMRLGFINRAFFAEGVE